MIAYQLGDSLYVNVTNRCTNNCTFCIRRTSSGVGGYNLWLQEEPSVEEMLEAIGDPGRFKEVVFCGYGEPLMRVDEVIQAARALKEKYRIPIRIDTNGQANLIHGRNVVPELAGLVDTISISLNAENAEKYQSVSHSRYGAAAYQAVLDFAREGKKYIPRVVLTVVDVPEVDIEASRRIAGDLGVELRVRHYDPHL
ncbi:MAG: TatD family nuclease-associated radical SAM protein [Firmicutes bacterium]|nr:TatD family nuclease-associated radical SAM protein [Bacillota bacterium]